MVKTKTINVVVPPGIIPRQEWDRDFNWDTDLNPTISLSIARFGDTEMRRTLLRRPDVSGIVLSELLECNVNEIVIAARLEILARYERSHEYDTSPRHHA